MPFSRIEAMSMAAAARGDAGSRNPVTQRPGEVRLSVLGVKLNAIAIVAGGAPRFSRIETVFDALFATARSGRPSALRSAIATEEGSLPATKSVLARNVPSPRPISTEIVFE